MLLLLVIPNVQRVRVHQQNGNELQREADKITAQVGLRRERTVGFTP